MNISKVMEASKAKLASLTSLNGFSEYQGKVEDVYAEAEKILTEYQDDLPKLNAVVTFLTKAVAASKAEIKEAEKAKKEAEKASRVVESSKLIPSITVGKYIYFKTSKIEGIAEVLKNTATGSSVLLSEEVFDEMGWVAKKDSVTGKPVPKKLIKYVDTYNVFDTLEAATEFFNTLDISKLDKPFDFRDGPDTSNEETDELEETDEELGSEEI